MKKSIIGWIIYSIAIFVTLMIISLNGIGSNTWEYWAIAGCLLGCFTGGLIERGGEDE